MRRIKSQAEIEKRQKRMMVWLAGTMVFLMLASTIGYSFMSRDEESSTINQRGLKFRPEGETYTTLIGDQTFRFSNLPDDTINVSVNISSTLQDYSNKPLYLVGPNTAHLEILNFLTRFVLRYQEACLEEGCKEDLPTKTCEDNVIVFIEGEETKVYNDKNCVYIEGDLILGTDAFLYEILGANEK